MNEENNSEFELDEIYYDHRGNVVKLIAYTTDNRYVVQRELCDYYGETYFDDTIVLSAIFHDVPNNSIVNHLKKEIEQLEITRSELLTEIAILETKESILQKAQKLAQYQGLEYIEDFLSKDINFFIEISDYRLKICSKGEFDVRGYHGRQKGSPRLISLKYYKGQFQWFINEYQDGSGLENIFIPCPSLEVAVERVATILSKELTKIQDAIEKGINCNNLHDIEVVKQSMEIGLEIPKIVNDFYKEQKRQGIENIIKAELERIRESQTIISEYKTKLEELEKEDK